MTSYKYSLAHKRTLDSIFKNQSNGSIITHYKQNSQDIGALYAPWSSGYRLYINLSESLTLMNCAYKNGGSPINTLFQFDDTAFFTLSPALSVTNRIADTTNFPSCNYAYKINGNATIKFVNNTLVTLVLVGGGGGGGYTTTGVEGCGGGGGGGMWKGTVLCVANNEYTFGIGNGGSSAKGGNTTFGDGGLVCTAYGGGYGGTQNSRPGAHGWCGGGGCGYGGLAARGTAITSISSEYTSVSLNYLNYLTSIPFTPSTVPPLVTTGGVISTVDSSGKNGGGGPHQRGGGGGGGLSAAGETPTNKYTGGNGGNGTTVYGVAVCGGGGGGLGSGGSWTGGTGGTGGGGVGSNGGNGGSGGPNTGGGGGGGGFNSYGYGSAGGSGVAWIIF